MDVVQAFILGLVQGLTEFLPVSSSGHLLLVRNIMGITGDYIFFDLMLHLGTLVAIAITMRRQILALLRPPYVQAILIVIASIPAVVLGFALRDVIGDVFGDARYLTFFFMFTAITLLLSQWLSKVVLVTSDQVNLKSAICMGLAQGVAVFPGVSRSGSTISGGIASGASRKSVAIFSFLMSIPIILGGAVVESLGNNIFDNISMTNVLVGGLASFVSGILAINLMLKVIAKADFKWFSLYLIILSIITFFVYFI